MLIRRLGVTLRLDSSISQILIEVIGMMTNTLNIVRNVHLTTTQKETITCKVLHMYLNGITTQGLVG
jgi:hypothetical protein